MLLTTGARLLSLLRQTFLPQPFPGTLQYLRRLAVLCLFLPAFVALQALHWIGLLLDECLFRGYRQIDVRQPIFVLGVPRSGTTFMHRLLAHHEGLTTFSTWECLLAPSISERYLYLSLAAVDRRLGRPVGRLLGWLGKRLFGWLGEVHPLHLTAPEEDYFTLLPVLACFILVVPFPESDWLWRLGRCDRDMSADERRRLLAWYRRCLQRHLYVHGRDRTLLSKNASFAGMACSLVAEFPDCRVVLCERDALAAVRSQFRALEGGLRLFGISETNEIFRYNLLNCLNFYYQNLDQVAATCGSGKLIRVPLWMLSGEPRAVLGDIAARFGLSAGASLDRELDHYEATRRPRREAPARAGVLTGWGLDPVEVAQRFAAWRHEEGLRI